MYTTSIEVHASFDHKIENSKVTGIILGSFRLFLGLTNQEKFVESNHRFAIQRKGDHAPRWSTFVLGLKILRITIDASQSDHATRGINIFYYFLIYICLINQKGLRFIIGKILKATQTLFFSLASAACTIRNFSLQLVSEPRLNPFN